MGGLDRHRRPALVPHLQPRHPVVLAPKAASSVATCPNSRVPDKFIHAPWTAGGIDQTACRTKISVDYPPVVDHAAARERTPGAASGS